MKQLYLQYNHLNHLQTISFRTYIPFRQMELFKALFANDPPPSLAELRIEMLLMWRKDPRDDVPSTVVKFLNTFGINRLDMFLLRPCFKHIKDVVLKVSILRWYQSPDLNKDVQIIRWPDSVASKVPLLLEKKGLEMKIMVD